MVSTKKMVLRTVPTPPRATSARSAHGRSDHTSPLRVGGPAPACSGDDAELFWPATGEEAQQAIALCGDCPLRQACLEAGVRGREWGVWGGALLERGQPSDVLPGSTRPGREVQVSV